MCFLVTKEELEQPRTPDELWCWLDKKLRTIGQTEEGKNAVRFRQGLCKELVEEVYALGILCQHKYPGREDIVVEPVIGNQNFDAILTDHSETPPTSKRLEITEARWGEREHLQMIHLQEHGYSPYFGTVGKQGTKKTGLTVTIHGEAQAHMVSLEQSINLIEDAIRNKLAKNYEKGTNLLVMTEDVACFRDEADRCELLRLLVDRIAPINRSFDAIYVAGWSKETLVEWPVS